jgi:hypothetical protein
MGPRELIAHLDAVLRLLFLGSPHIDKRIGTGSRTAWLDPDRLKGAVCRGR